MAFKRKRVYAPKSSWGGKKRRTLRKRGSRFKRNVRRMPRMASNNTRSTGATNMLVGRRKLNKRKFNNILWNMTVPMQHYRSAAAQSVAVSVSVNVPVGNWVMTAFTPLSETNPFWTVTGGLQAVNFALTPVPPTLSPNTVIIRGGFTRLAVKNNDTAVVDVLRIRIQKAYVKQQLRNYTDANSVSPFSEWLAETVNDFNITAGVTVGQANSLTIADRADYDEYLHRPVDDKEMLLQPNDEFEVKEKMHVKKVDCDAFARGGKYYPIYFVYIGNEGSAGGAAVSCNVLTSHNLSFAVVDL